MRYADPRRHWRRITEIANPRVRLERVRALAGRIRNELDELASEEARLAAAYANLGAHPGHSSPELFKLRGLQGLALLLVALDVPVQLLLNSAALPGVEGWKVALGSVGLALGIAGAVHLVLVHLVHDSDRPARTIRLCKTFAGLSFLATALGATVFLFARQASPDMAAYLVTLTAVSLWTVAEALPLSAGFFSAWAHVLAEPVRAERALRRVRILNKGHEEFLDRLEGEERRLLAEVPSANGDGVAVPDPDQLGLFPGGARAARRVSGLLIALLAIGAGAAPLAAQSAPEEAAPERRLCAAFVDRTRSLDPVHREAALRVFLERLPGFLEEAGCTDVLAGTFADEGAWTPRRSLRVPAPPDTLSCTAREPAVPHGAAGLLLGLRGFRDHFRGEVEEACQEERVERLERHRWERHEVLRSLLGTLSAPQLKQETETDIVGLVESVLAAGAMRVWLLTDGIETMTGADAKISLAEHHRIVFVLVPAREAYGGTAEVEGIAVTWRAIGVETVRYVLLQASPRNG